MNVKFEHDINVDELNLPPWNKYDEASGILEHVKIENFIKKYWDRLKLQVTDNDIKINQAMREMFYTRTIGKKLIEIDYTQVTTKDNVYWFRPSECFSNVIVPVFLLNDRQSSEGDRFQIIVNHYHAAIVDMNKKIIYDPTVDVLEALGVDYLADEKKISTLGLLMSEEAINVMPAGIRLGTLSLSEYLNKYNSKKGDCSLREMFNRTLGYEALKLLESADLVNLNGK